MHEIPFSDVVAKVMYVRASISEWYFKNMKFNIWVDDFLHMLRAQDSNSRRSASEPVDFQSPRCSERSSEEDCAVARSPSRG